MPPQTQGTIPADVIGSNQQPLPVSPPPVQDRAGLLSSVQSGIDQNTLDLKTVQGKRDTVDSDVTNLLTGLGGQEKYKQQLEEQQGLTQLESQLSDVSSRISANNRLNPARLLQAEQNVIGTGVTKGMLSTRLSNVERDNAIQSLVLAAEGDMIQGRVGAANARIERAMTAKFEPMKQELEVKMFNLKRLDERVKEGQLTLSDAQKTKLNLQMGQIEKDEKDMADSQSIGLELIKNGAPASMKTAIMSAKSKAELLTIPGVERYLTSPLERMQLAKEGLTIQKLKAEMSNSGAGGLTADQREKLLSNKTALQASARIGLNKALDLYKKEAEKVQLKGGVTSPADKTYLRGLINNVVQPTLSVANGQGALSEDEAARLLKGLDPATMRSWNQVYRNINGTVNTQNTLIDSDLSFIDSAIPGASTSFQFFSDYKNENKDNSTFLDDGLESEAELLPATDFFGSL